MQKKLKIITVLGTRPEIIRLSRIIPLLDEFTDHVTIHTGQNYDYELNEVFYRDLVIRKPDYYLDVDTSTIGHVIGETIMKCESIFKKNNPDGVLILGDTNSSLAAIIAKRLRIPIFHMEAGNRCFDLNVPEEINRKIVDHISDFNLVYTEHARRNLINEGFPHRRIFLTGSPMGEVLDFYKKQIQSSKILKSLNLKRKEYFVLSSHREENVDNPLRLKAIVNLANQLSKKYNMPVIFSTHPRTKDRIKKIKLKTDNKNLIFHKPFGFFDYVNLQQNSLCTLSDSGTISEEAAILNFPAVTLRNSMERPEAMDFGNIVLTGFDEEIVLTAVDLSIKEKDQRAFISLPPEYQVKDTSWRVIKLILGISKLSNIWAGIQKLNM